MSYNFIGPTFQLGERIIYDLAPKTRVDYFKKYLPADINNKKFFSLFKKDIFLDCIAERLYNVKLFYIEQIPKHNLTQNFKDESYYFAVAGNSFYGELALQAFHPFAKELHKIKPTHVINSPSLFVGTRNNYTHQIVDFLPNLLFAQKHLRRDFENRKIILGDINNIISGLMSDPSLSNMMTIPNEYICLKTLGTSSSIYAHWNVRCIEFKDLILFRHISIFKGYDLLRSFFASNCNSSHHLSKKPYIGYLSRSDLRVQNQKDIEEYINSLSKSEVIKNLSSLSINQKYSLLKWAKTLIFPSGSENINAFCFGNNDCQFIQMINLSLSKMLESPFNSYLGLRYNLPFLHRTKFWSASKQGSLTYSGIWDPQELVKLIFK